MTSPANAAADGRQAAVREAAERLYDAEIALHIARQTGVSAWISAAYDRLHEAVVAHNAAITALPQSRQCLQPRQSPQPRQNTAQPELRPVAA